MEAKGLVYDILTDDDLHHEGVSLLKPYKVILTGSHPEYYSEQMLDALTSYLQNGGRLMYLGGNGFYWITSMTLELPHIIEIRRWGGTESWLAEPGEYYHSNTAELGGLWRHRGRVPQRMVGVGFTAQGWHEELPQCAPGRPYRRNPDSFDPRASFIFEGVGSDELIGDFESLALVRGAAGDELDRFDPLLGTPSHALCLATATGFGKEYLHVVEEILIEQQTRTPDPFVRSDMVYFEYPNGGAVFSVGSISWFGSLSYNGYQNNVSKITENVLRRFSSDAALAPDS
jgi:N,N-dimethylformamidase